MIDSAMLLTLLFMNTLGETVLVQSFKDAYFYYKSGRNGSSKKNGVYASAYSFVQGSGLNYTIQEYGLDLNAEELRDTFNYKLRRLVCS